MLISLLSYLHHGETEKEYFLEQKIKSKLKDYIWSSIIVVIYKGIKGEFSQNVKTNFQ